MTFLKAPKMPHLPKIPEIHAPGNVGKYVGSNISGLSAGVGKGINSLGAGVGGGLSSVGKAIMPVEKQLFNQASSAITSPLVYVGVAIVGAVVLVSIFKGSEVANNGIGAVRDNPELAATLAASLR
jgi:hypothetical protein